MALNIAKIGDECTLLIKQASFFPYKTGKLKFQATSGAMYMGNVYRIHFDSTVAPYVAALEEGSKPHDIPMAFGRKLPFGIGGRFDGKFHPGSMKHKDFIKRDCVNAIISYICERYGGIVR